MLAVIPKPGISSRRKAAAVMVAGVVDLLQLWFVPLFGEGFISPFEDALDVMAAIVLTAICGFKWQFALAFGLELIPFFDILPTWTAVALLLPVNDRDVSGQRVNVTVTGERAANLVEVEGVVIPPVQAPPVQRIGGGE